jgi:hypothetical protein
VVRAGVHRDTAEPKERPEEAEARWSRREEEDAVTCSPYRTTGQAIGGPKY